MKQLTLLLMLVVAGCGENKNTPNNDYYEVSGKKWKRVYDKKNDTSVFHISVVPYDISGTWTIRFTNNNWDDAEELKIWLPMIQEDNIYLEYDKEKAIELAKTLSTYQKCVEHNEKVSKMKAQNVKTEIKIY